MTTDGMGLQSGLSEPAVISAVTMEIAANCRVELTDVKIYLEGNHAANRGTGIEAETAWSPLTPVKTIHGKHFSSAAQFILLFLSVPLGLMSKPSLDNSPVFCA